MVVTDSSFGLLDTSLSYKILKVKMDVLIATVVVSHKISNKMSKASEIEIFLNQGALTSTKKEVLKDNDDDYIL